MNYSQAPSLAVESPNPSRQRSDWVGYASIVSLVARQQLGADCKERQSSEHGF
jgi:hypothetical protein